MTDPVLAKTSPRQPKRQVEEREKLIREQAALAEADQTDFAAERVWLEADPARLQQIFGT